MHVDNVEVQVGVTFFDDIRGAGNVKTINADSFEVDFGHTKSTYWGNGLLAGRKLLRAERPLALFPTADQRPILLKIVEALGIRTAP
jgi:hypothetical protein